MADVIKERLQVQSTLAALSGRDASTMYKGNIDAAVNILKTEGLRGNIRLPNSSISLFRPFPLLSFRCLFSQALEQIEIDLFHVETSTGIYKGYGATVMSFGPFSALYFVFYENLKQTSGKLLHCTNNSLPFGVILFCSAAAGSLASFWHVSLYS